MPTLRTYQEDAVQFLAAHPRALLALPPGAGKTAVVTTSIAPSERTLVVAPNGPVLNHWQYECTRWNGVTPVVGAGSKLQRHRARVLADHLVVNYEAFRSDIEELLSLGFDTVIFDESHRLKNRTSQTFKAAQKLAKRVGRLYLVTGTPVLNRASELWSSLHLMAPDRYKSFWRWAEYHFEINYPRYRRRVVREVGDIRPGHVELLRHEIAEFMYYRPMSELLPDLPPVTETYFNVELSRPEREAYETMSANFWMEVGDDIIQAPNAIAKQTRLRQLSSDWSCWGEPPGTKAQAAAQLVEDLDGEQCLVFCAFRGTAEASASIMPGAAAYYHGGLNEKERDERIEGFKSGKIRTLVATIRTLGEGVDGLQVARNAILIDRDWTPARNDQAIDRLAGGLRRRQSVNVTHIVADDTVDDTVASALREKRDVISAVIERVSHPLRTVKS